MIRWWGPKKRKERRRETPLCRGGGGGGVDGLRKTMTALQEGREKEGEEKERGEGPALACVTAFPLPSFCGLERKEEPLLAFLLLCACVPHSHCR